MRSDCSSTSNLDEGSEVGLARLCTPCSMPCSMQRGPGRAYALGNNPRLPQTSPLCLHQAAPALRRLDRLMRSRLLCLQRCRLVACRRRPGSSERLFLSRQRGSRPARHLSLMPLLHPLQLRFVGLHQALQGEREGQLVSLRRRERCTLDAEISWLQASSGEPLQQPFHPASWNLCCAWQHALPSRCACLYLRLQPADSALLDGPRLLSHPRLPLGPLRGHPHLLLTSGE